MLCWQPQPELGFYKKLSLYKKLRIHKKLSSRKKCCADQCMAATKTPHRSPSRGFLWPLFIEVIKPLYLGYITFLRSRSYRVTNN